VVPPTIAYATSGGLQIAYQVVGEGPNDLLYVPGWVSNLEVMWEDPGLARFLNRLASFSRLIIFDKRGTGLSDRVDSGALPTLEERIDDVRAVLDAVGSRHVTLLGHSEGGNMSILFAATYPAQVDGLILLGSFARRIRSDDYPWAPTQEEREAEIARVRRTWGSDESVVEYNAPSRAADPAFRSWALRYMRLSASPNDAARLLEMNSLIDVRPILPTIRVPTLLIYRTDDRDVNVEEGRYIATRIPVSRFVELPGGDHFFWAGDTAPLLEEIEEFVTGHRAPSEPDRVLATILFTDVVGSTERLVAAGDTRWRSLLASHDSLVRSELERWRGRLVKGTGDGILATFDGPARAIRAAHGITQAAEGLGLGVRAGIHTGEVELLDRDVGGIAVHTAARVADAAGEGEVLVSRTVRDLIAGSGIDLESKGEHHLKGVPGVWELFSVQGS
jgi:pimeloyl-ACP methyl ester carboxylesterase